MVYPDGREWARTTTRQNDSARGQNFERNQTLYRSDAERGWNAEVQLEAMDTEGIDVAVLYPTLGILWEAELSDVELSQAYCRAYNRWIADFCRPTRARLIPIAHLSLGDPAAAAVELERAAKDGCRGAFVVPFAWTHKAHGDPVHRAMLAFFVKSRYG